MPPSNPQTVLSPCEVLISSHTAKLQDVVIVGSDDHGLWRIFSSSGDRKLILAKLRGAIDWIEKGCR